MGFRSLVVLPAAVVSLLAFSCHRKPSEEAGAPLSYEEQAMYLEKGQKIAGLTFAELSGKLQTELKAGGVAQAITYCNLSAFPLVDSLSKAQDAAIRRTSLKVRNPNNAPDAAEKSMLEAYEKSAAAGRELAPEVQQIDQQTVAFYAPIRVNPFCLQCHGKAGETLQAEDLALIRRLYPDDQATGYGEGDLRGMWSIRLLIKN